MLKGAALASALTLLIAGVWWQSLPRSAHQQASTDVAVELAAMLDESPCHTAVAGEKCFTDVHWAMTQGINGHPEWYTEKCPHLKAYSSFEEFQKCVYVLNRGSCPHQPCKEATPPAVVTVQTQPVREVPDLRAHDDDVCHTAAKGDTCYEAILKAIAQGTIDSSRDTIEKVQETLHHRDSHTCHKPCECERPEADSQCYKHVEWALNGGLKNHPFWYKDLSGDATFEEVQQYLYEKHSCPPPCRAIPVAILPGSSQTEGRKHRFPGTDGAARSQHDDGACRAVSPTEICYTNVLYGMRRGLYEHSEWYPGMDEFSSFEDFQAVLNRNPDLKCPKPCPCKTATYEDKCYKNVKWVLNEGIHKHPEWYPNLTDSSRWEVVQERLHTEDADKCGKPCTPKVWGDPSMFCFSVFRSTGYEMELVKSQLQKGVGIFSCDEFAIMSDQKLAIRGAVKTLIVPGIENIGVSKDGTAANAKVFMQAWRVLGDEGRYKAHDWVIKADPDAVVIADRLRNRLAPQTGKNVFIQNCMKYSGPGWPTMFGSLEAYSQKAMKAYFDGGYAKCTQELQWTSWGEDLFMNSCMTQILGVKPVFDGQVVGDNVCKGADCADGVSASYHPFKSPEAWFQCYGQATGVTYFKK